MTDRLRIDWTLFLIATSLALFGSAMVYSASAMISMRETQSATQFAYFYKQFAFTVLGLGVMYLGSRIDYRRYASAGFAYGSIALTAFLLIAVFLFPPINGASRWIRAGSFSFQPSELAKVTLPIFLAFFLSREGVDAASFRRGVLPCLVALGVLALPILLEPDLGTTIVLCAVFASIYFAAGAKLFHLVPVAAGMFVFGAAALVFAPWRLQRLAAFLDPCDPQNAADTGYQVCQSLYAIGTGGVLGQGFGNGEQKLFYLPYPYSDFIFSVVGEEFGLVGTLAIVFAFGFILWRGTRAALTAPDRFGMLLGFGLVTGVVVQALFNISVVTSILPAKGIPLPFISYGGSSVLVTLFAIGILLNISESRGEAGHAAVDRPTNTWRRSKSKA